MVCLQVVLHVEVKTRKRSDKGVKAPYAGAGPQRFCDYTPHPLKPHRQGKPHRETESDDEVCIHTVRLGAGDGPGHHASLPSMATVVSLRGNHAPPWGAGVSPHPPQRCSAQARHTTSPARVIVSRSRRTASLQHSHKAMSLPERSAQPCTRQ